VHLHTCFPGVKRNGVDGRHHQETMSIWDWLQKLKFSCREREREIYFKSHISLWEHSSHFRLIGRGVPSVSVVSQLMYKFLCLASPKENPQVEPSCIFELGN